MHRPITFSQGQDGFPGDPGRARFLSEAVAEEFPENFALSVLLLADEAHSANAVRHHFGAFTQYSCHSVTVVNPRAITSPAGLVSSLFDVVIVHYSIYVLSEAYLSKAWREYIAQYHGVKIVIHEDEYHNINAFKMAFAALGIDALISCLDSPQTLRKVYGGQALAHVEFYCGLPGYMTDTDQMKPAPPVALRPIDIVYRGRTLPPQLGRFAQEKRQIGEKVGKLAVAYGLCVDIAVDEEARIYGDEWPRFLRSGRAMLGVEGGATIFDFDGSIAERVAALQKQESSSDFESIWHQVLAPYENNIIYKTITPKFFEAIIAKTALVLFPGNYSGILKPGRNYIMLERDMSNFPEVVKRLRDHEALQRMVDTTYQDVVSNSDLHIRNYIRNIDAVISRIALRKHSVRLTSFGRDMAFWQQRMTLFGLNIRQVVLRGWKIARSATLIRL